jgi:hypothetical protein
MTVELLEPILHDGIRTTHFFNGRLLTAGDFETLQRAVLERERRLGRTIGDGVVTGLEVALDRGASTIQRPIVRVTSGLAINREGTVLALPSDTTVALTREVVTAPLGDAEFNACPPPGPQPQPPSSALNNVGFYILTVLPASGYEGRAPMTGLDQEGVGGTCGSRYAVSGVRFRLVRVPIAADSTSTMLRQQVVQVAGELNTLMPQLAAPNPPLSVRRDAMRKTSQVRNGLAHLCFGSDRWQEFPSDPLGFFGNDASLASARTFLEELQASEVLTDDEVPLGLVWWTSQGVGFVDQWAVRRPLTRLPMSAVWPGRAFHRRANEMLAMILQSQRQLTDVAREPANLGSPIAREWLFYAPPILWVGGEPGQPSVDPLILTSGMTVRGPLFVEGLRLGALLEVAVAFGPVPVGTTEFFWHYLVRENRQGVDQGVVSAARRYSIIASGHLPDMTNPRFDLARFNYSNIAIGTV